MQLEPLLSQRDHVYERLVAPTQTPVTAVSLEPTVVEPVAEGLTIFLGGAGPLAAGPTWIEFDACSSTPSRPRSNTTMKLLGYRV